MRNKSTLLEAIANYNNAYWCDDCGWAEDEGDLQLCPSCEGRLVCHECRVATQSDFCTSCSEFDLPDGVKLVGDNDKCDLVFKVRSWVGVCVASHYYVTLEESYHKYGRLDFSDLYERVRLTTERIQGIPSFIRRVLRVVVHRHRNALSKRKDQKLRIRIEHKDTRMRLAKIQLTRPLDGD